MPRDLLQARRVMSTFQQPRPVGSTRRDGNSFLPSLFLFFFPSFSLYPPGNIVSTGLKLPHFVSAIDGNTSDTTSCVTSRDSSLSDHAGSHLLTVGVPACPDCPRAGTVQMLCPDTSRHGLEKKGAQQPLMHAELDSSARCLWPPGPSALPTSVVTDRSGRQSRRALWRTGLSGGPSGADPGPSRTPLVGDPPTRTSLPLPVQQPDCFRERDYCAVGSASTWPASPDYGPGTTKLFAAHCPGGQDCLWRFPI